MLLAILYYNSQDGVFNTPGKCLTLVLLINNMFTNSGSGPMGAVASITGWSRCALTGNKSSATLNHACECSKVQILLR